MESAAPLPSTIVGSEFCPYACEPAFLDNRATCLPQSEPELKPHPVWGKIPVSWPNITALEKTAVQRTMADNWISSQGPVVREFEKIFAEKVGARYATAVNSGTGALTVTMMALGIGVGDRVIVPTFTMIASVLCFSRLGAAPVFVDCDEYYQMEVSQLAKAAEDPRVKAIMPVHIYGHPVDMDLIEEIGHAHKIPVIYDAAEAHGAEYRGQPIGNRGLASCYSFFANKVIQTGEGGMIVSDNEEFIKLCRNLADVSFSRERHFWHYRASGNFRMTSLQAAVGVAQCKRFDELVRGHRKNAWHYHKLLADVSGIKFQPQAHWANSVHWMVGLTIDQKRFGMSRCQLRKYLADRGIETRTYFIPMHMQPAFFRAKEHYPSAELLCRDGLYLPSSSGLSMDMRETVAQVVREAHVAAFTNDKVRPGAVRDYYPGARYTLEEHTQGRLTFLMRTESTDPAIINEVIVLNQYIRNELSISAGDVVVDVGGHIGAFTCLAASLGASVIVTEPVDINRELLEYNVRKNNFSDQVTVHPFAIAEKAGPRSITIRNKNFGGCNLYGKKPRWKQDVDCVPLSDIMPEGGCDFLKLDCEDAELEALKSADLSGVRQIALEYVGVTRGKEIATFLDEAGYEMSIEWPHPAHHIGFIHAFRIQG